MSKTKKPAPAPITTSFDTRLADELTNLVRLTNKAVKVEGTTEEPKAVCANLDSSINALTLVRALVKDTDTAKKAALAVDIPPEVQAKVKAIETEAKRIKLAADMLESRLAEAIGAEVAAKRITETTTSEAGCQLILQHRKALEIIDETVIPEAFTRRVPDFAAIEAALKEWQVRCDAADVLKLPHPPCPVPGARIGEKIVLVTKAPELIEE